LKIVGLGIILLMIGGILVSGCVLKPTANETVVQTPPQGTVITTIGTPANVIQTAVPVLGNVPEGIPFGRLNVSIGDYNAKLPVYVDNMSAGQVSGGKMLNLRVSEGTHSVKVCSGTVCELVGVEIKSGVKATIDFEERLKTDAPQGSLSISSGNYPTTNLPVYIDNLSVGIVAPGKPLVQLVAEGLHVVKICNGNTCFSQNVTIKSTNQTTVDFENQLKSGVAQGSLTVSIGGFKAEDLPVLVDNISAGNVSQGRSLDLMLKEGNHTVQVCAGSVCENQDIQIKFAKQSLVDFGDRLKADIEFPTPTVRITDSALSGPELSVQVEFINPDKTDHSMTGTVSCVYSYIDSLTRTMKGGSRDTQEVSLYLGGGSNVIANPPVLVDVEIK
jgi:hypothetical protein